MGPTEPTQSATIKSFVVPKLAQDGSNWVTWKSQTLAVLASSRGVMQHVQGMARVPAPLPDNIMELVLMDEMEEELEKLEQQWDDYNQREAMIKAQLFTTIPEGLLIKVQKLATAKQVWNAVCAKHESRAIGVKINIRRHMYEMKCEDDANVRTHLESLPRSGIHPGIPRSL
jgi:gag-polypeptide of LTR copia-type